MASELGNWFSIKFQTVEKKIHLVYYARRCTPLKMFVLEIEGFKCRGGIDKIATVTHGNTHTPVPSVTCF
jgi:hypothetical protein